MVAGWTTSMFICLLLIYLFQNIQICCLFDWFQNIKTCLISTYQTLFFFKKKIYCNEINLASTRWFERKTGKTARCLLFVVGAFVTLNYWTTALVCRKCDKKSNFFSLLMMFFFSFSFWIDRIDRDSLVNFILRCQVSIWVFPFSKKKYKFILHTYLFIWTKRTLRVAVLPTVRAIWLTSTTRFLVWLGTLFFRQHSPSTPYSSAAVLICRFCRFAGSRFWASRVWRQSIRHLRSARAQWTDSASRAHQLRATKLHRSSNTHIRVKRRAY